jgi:hypothetical protein
MATTFTKIASVTVGSGGASSIDFTSIPSIYTDLCVKVSIRDNYPYEWGQVNMRFNGSSTGYSGIQLQGTGSATGSSSSSSWGTTYIVSGRGTGANATANTFGNSEIYIPNYAGSSYKSISTNDATENNGTAAFLDVVAGLWSNTAAITSISLFDTGYTIQQYSTATLYGISKS